MTPQEIMMMLRDMAEVMMLVMFCTSSFLLVKNAGKDSKKIIQYAGLTFFFGIMYVTFVVRNHH